MEETSEISEVSQNLNLNSKTHKQHFARHSVEASESDSFDNDVGLTPKTEISNRVINKDTKNDSKFSHDENSIQGFYVSPVKVTKTDQGKPESQHRKIVTGRFSESSSDISMDDSLVLHNNRE